MARKATSDVSATTAANANVEGQRVRILRRISQPSTPTACLPSTSVVLTDQRATLVVQWTVGYASGQGRWPPGRR